MLGRSFRFTAICISNAQRIHQSVHCTQQLYKIFKCQMYETKAVIRLNLIVSTNKLRTNE